MSRVDEIVREAESLEPDERLQLIAVLLATLPPKHWAAPSAFQQAEFRRRFGTPGPDCAPEEPWDALRRVMVPAYPQEPVKLYAASRRFDLATVFVAMAVFSVLMAIMSLVGFGAGTKIYLGVFIVVVGVGQAFLEPHMDARRASMLVGAGFHTLCSTIFWFTLPESVPFATIILVVLINGLVLGAAMGYMAGALVGGVYLIADALRGRFGRATSEGANEAGTSQVVSVHPLDSVESPAP